ncbi:MAG: hypothetical protein C4326_02975 [Ignavibacteria bacterium]
MGQAFWARVWVLLVLGYALMGRTFAYLGVPSLKVFIGELILGAFVIIRGNRVLRTWFTWLLGYGPRALLVLAWASALFFSYGILQAMRGVLLLGHELIIVLQNFVFNVYPLYLFLGLWVGQARPALLRNVVRWLAWANGIYGTLYVLLLNRLDVTLPWAPDITLFGQPGGSALALLGLLSLESRPVRVWPLLVLNFFVLLGVQVRGEWLALGAGLFVWMVLRRDPSRVALLGATAVLLFAAMYALDLRIPAPETRGGEISVRGVVARGLAPLNPDAAATLIGEEAYSLAGTIMDWRVPWWLSIWDEVHRDVISALLGLGYGYPLYSLLPFISEGIRTPHNVFFYALGYSGWLGVIFFFTFQFSLGYAVYWASMSSKNHFGPALWVSLLCSALVGNFFETPFGAIPFYLLIGYGLSPLSQAYARANSSHVLPTTRR